MLPHRSQELKEMLPALVLSMAIMAEFWRPIEKQGKAEWIKY